MEQKKFCLSKTDKKLGGVCGGIAEYMGVDSTAVRIVAVILLLFTNLFMLLSYITLWALIPNE